MNSPLNLSSYMLVMFTGCLPRLIFEIEMKPDFVRGT